MFLSTASLKYRNCNQEHNSILQVFMTLGQQIGINIHKTQLSWIAKRHSNSVHFFIQSFIPSLWIYYRNLETINFACTFEETHLSTEIVQNRQVPPLIPKVHKTSVLALYPYRYTRSSHTMGYIEIISYSRPFENNGIPISKRSKVLHLNGTFSFLRFWRLWNKVFVAYWAAVGIRDTFKMCTVVRLHSLINVQGVCLQGGGF